MRPHNMTVIDRAAVYAALLALMLMLGIVSAGNSQAEMRKDILRLVTQSGEHAFQVEVAESPEEKSRGLMFRRSLADDAGMLFPYEPPQEASMWMKNTYISLDMVFIRADGTVHRVEPGTEPFSEAVISSGGTVSAVLELKAGTAARIGLKAGDKAVHGLFKPKR
ncbi:MAG: DUF192 domain-containing protein [Hyphomicrobiaceae bacterium]|nr:DUF192 domain-containing protein [Hyphomicrobiaceae bacterium]